MCTRAISDQWRRPSKKEIDLLLFEVLFVVLVWFWLIVETGSRCTALSSFEFLT